MKKWVAARDIWWKICILSIISDNISYWHKSVNLKMHMYVRLYVTCIIITDPSRHQSCSLRKWFRDHLKWSKEHRLFLCKHMRFIISRRWIYRSSQYEPVQINEAHLMFSPFLCRFFIITAALNQWIQSYRSVWSVQGSSCYMESSRKKKEACWL